MSPTCIKKRIFVVGCPRSGTTLLQGMLAAHPDVFSLPETFFFAKATTPLSPLRRYFLWPALKARRYLPVLLRDMGRDDLLEFARIGWLQRDYARPFVEVMDTMALQAGKQVWVEKTPAHLYCIDDILRAVPDAEIVHIVRNGADTAASLISATRKNPRQWAKFGRWRRRHRKGFSAREAVQRWNRDFLITRQYMGKPHHTVIRYEDILNNPVETARHLCTGIGLSFHNDMTNPSTAFRQIVNQNEPWKANNLGQIGQKDAVSVQLLTQDELVFIKENTLPYEL